MHVKDKERYKTQLDSYYKYGYFIMKNGHKSSSVKRKFLKKGHGGKTLMPLNKSPPKDIEANIGSKNDISQNVIENMKC